MVRHISAEEIGEILMLVVKEMNFLNFWFFFVRFLVCGFWKKFSTFDVGVDVNCCLATCFSLSDEGSELGLVKSMDFEVKFVASLEIWATDGPGSCGNGCGLERRWKNYKELH